MRLAEGRKSFESRNSQAFVHAVHNLDGNVHHCAADYRYILQLYQH